MHKFICNDKLNCSGCHSTVLPGYERTESGSDLYPLPIERTLGLEWCVESDTFQFRITLKDKPFSRRGILSTVSSVLDPLGLVCRFMLAGKQILQELVHDGKGWDDPVPDLLRARWEKWRNELPTLATVQVPRCYKGTNFGNLLQAELHSFSVDMASVLTCA